MKEKWLVQAKKADFNSIADKYGISPVIARIMRNRDIISDNEINSYLYGSLEELYSPRLLKDLGKAVEIINKKISDKKKIRVIGDYDIDGVCAGNILVRGLEILGADVSFAVPDRILDGYGINIRIIEDAVRDNIDTIITCDNGIAAYDEILFAKEKGLTVIITDHHEVPERIPVADAVIDPKQKDCTYPFKDICGATVAYKLIEELFEFNQTDVKELDWMLELAGMATIGDVVDLKDENRIIAKNALRLITNTNNPGIRALKKVNNLEEKDITSYHIGFVIGPCLNAGGRLDTAMKSYRLLSGKEADIEALAVELKELNDERKQLTIEAVEDAVNMIESDSSYENDTVLVIYLPKCHESLAGIVAGRIRERYNKPTFVITKANNMIKGSGRSMEGYNMYEELTKCSDLLARFGGHEMAAGLSLEEKKLETFREKINANSKLTEEDITYKVWIDVPMPFEYISEGFINQLKILEPFGKANSKPVFAEKNLSVKNIRIFGANRNVIKINFVSESGYSMEGVYFAEEVEFLNMMQNRYGVSELDNALKGKHNNIKMNITYFPEVNEYNGNRYLQVVIGKIQL